MFEEAASNESDLKIFVLHYNRGSLLSTGDDWLQSVSLAGFEKSCITCIAISSEM